MDTLMQDVRFALRSLRKNLSITLLAGLSLALAVAGNTVVFSVVNGLLYRPLPYPEPERIVLLSEIEEGDPLDQVSATSAATWLDWRERQRSFSELAAARPTAVSLSAEGAGTERLGGVEVTPGFFPLLGASAAHGRLFTEDEAIPGNDRVAVLGRSLFEERFGGDPSVLGETLTLDGTVHTVVGVLEEGFEFLDPGFEIWLPLAIDRGELDRGERSVIGIARLAPGVEEAAAQAEMEAIAGDLAREHPESSRGFTVAVVNMRHEIPDSTNRQLFALIQGALLFVLLIACANIANLLLARARKRRREMAVRSSLGASGARLVRQLLTESLVLAGAGGGVGLALGWMGTRAVAAVMAPALPRAWMPVVDLNVVLFTLAVTVAAGLLFGLVPALQGRRLDLVGSLKDGARGADAGGRRWVSNGLVVAEIALSLVLLGGAAVMIQSFVELQRSDPGFETADLATFQLSLPESRYATPEARWEATRSLTERLEALPGVDSAVATSAMVRNPFLPELPYREGTRAPEDGRTLPRTQVLYTTPGLVETLGLRLLAGRDLGAEDRAGSEPVALVNRELASRVWGSGEAIGRRLTVGGGARRVVGVVADARHTLFAGEARRPTVYLPMAQDPTAGLAFALRSSRPPEELAGGVREAVTALDPEVAPTALESLESYLAQFFVGTRIFTSILGGFGLLALLLAVFGTYGVLAYTVSLRTHEIGVRMAMGARRSQIVGMITRHGLLLAGLGILLGLPGVVLVTRAVGSAVSTFVGIDPRVVVAVGGVLALVTVAASLLPARRAATVSPVRALSGR